MGILRRFVGVVWGEDGDVVAEGGSGCEETLGGF